LLPDSTETKKLSFYYYDRLKGGNIPVSASYDNNKATISHSYNTLYARIYIEYGSGDRRPFISIYTTEKPATVTLQVPIDKTDPFKGCTLINAQDNKQEFLASREYIREAQHSYKQLYDSLAPKWKAEDSLDYKRLKEAKMAIDSKQLEYIASHPNSYHSFTLFGEHTISRLSPGLLLEQFNTIFPANFRNSEEGASIKECLMNRAVIEGKRKAISFTTKDINNKKIVFEEIYNKKNVLLVFWGTWCPPCIDEIPLLREIRQRYSGEQLEIVSVATGSVPEKVRQIIKEEQMDWIHILNNDKISQLYQVHGYPETILIGTKGNIIYRYSDYPDLNLVNLKRILDARASIH
jgi:thiol-disulfide isomerase/thioredoxin